MSWSGIAWIIVACTSANHLGLIRAVEGVIHHRLPVVNCTKCLTFWSVLAYGVAAANPSFPTLHSSLRLLAVSFLASYAAIWLELLMYFIDTVYNCIYGTINKINPEEDGDEARG